MGWHRSNAGAVIRGSTWRSLTSTQFSGVSWRTDLAELLGGTSRACFAPNQCSAIDATRGVCATRDWQLAFVALCFAERRRIASESLPRNPAKSIGVPVPPPSRLHTPSLRDASSTARCHPGVSRHAPRAICPSRSQISCREPLRPSEVHVASWRGDKLTTPAVPQTCSPAAACQLA
jgi:hypothetical protein